MTPDAYDLDAATAIAVLVSVNVALCYARRFVASKLHFVHSLYFKIAAIHVVRVKWAKGESFSITKA